MNKRRRILDPRFSGFYRDYKGSRLDKPAPTTLEQLQVGKVRRRTEDILEASRLEDIFGEVWDE